MIRQRKPIAKVSAVQRQRLAQYAKVKKQWRQELMESGLWRCKKCGGQPENQPHHVRGKVGSLLWDTNWFVPICWTCHVWVHANPSAAKKLKLLCELGQWNTQIKPETV